MFSLSSKEFGSLQISSSQSFILSFRWTLIKNKFQILIMKLSILLLSMCTGASAFVGAPNRHALTTSSVTTTTLDVASLPSKDLDSWSGKPLNTHESTTPVADPKFSRLNRMMMKDVVLPPSFQLTWALGLLGPLIMMYHPCKSFVLCCDPCIL